LYFLNVVSIKYTAIEKKQVYKIFSITKNPGTMPKQNKVSGTKRTKKNSSPVGDGTIAYGEDILTPTEEVCVFDKHKDDDIIVDNDDIDIDDDDYFDAADQNSIDSNNSVVVVDANNNNDAITNNNKEGDTTLTLATLRDNIVSENTNKAYVGDIAYLLCWILKKEPAWLTEYGLEKLSFIFLQQEKETGRKFRSRQLIEIKKILREANTNPVVHLSAISATRFMEYIFDLENKKRPNKYLSKSSYGNQRSSLFHLFRMHNRKGYSDDFKVELGCLFKSFFRQITQHPSRGRESRGEAAIEDSKLGIREGKEPLSVEFYKAICGWLLDYGTTDGVFAYCYLTLTWNLACRAGNTSRILFRDVTWTDSFDSFSISFSHSKTDQLGEEAKYARHIFCNPLTPLVCPVLALSLYLTCCFNTQQSSESRLFPGVCQDSRFSLILVKLLNDKKLEVQAMGYRIEDIGTHSIRKGAVTYLASLPGGPPAATVCIRAGWTMGRVKDIYMRYVTSGDEFVGRCLALLSVLRTDFAVSPPHFVRDASWIEEGRLLQFPMVGLVVGFEKITRMCLATLLFHHRWLVDMLMVNHVVQMTSYLHRSEDLQAKKEFVCISYPWNDSSHVFSGIPPHVSVLQELAVIKDKQQRLIGEFVEEVTKVLSRYAADGGRLTEDHLRTVLAEFQNNFLQQLNNNNTTNSDSVIPTINNAEAGKVYAVHYYNGGIHRIPVDWRFPRCGVFDLWRHWWIGDDSRKVPPLRVLSAVDFRHLVGVPIGEEEMHGRTGAHKGKRRDCRKTWHDMKFLMEFVHKRVLERGFIEREITPAAVDRMFMAVVGMFTTKERDSQMRWMTVVHGVRRRNSKAG
jgi:hypothetical protein